MDAAIPDRGTYGVAVGAHGGPCRENRGDRFRAPVHPDHRMGDNPPDLDTASQADRDHPERGRFGQSAGEAEEHLCPPVGPNPHRWGLTMKQETRELTVAMIEDAFTAIHDAPRPNYSEREERVHRQLAAALPDLTPVQRIQYLQQQALSITLTMHQQMMGWANHDRETGDCLQDS